MTTTETAEHELLRSFAVDTLSHAARLQRARAANPARFEALRQFLPGPDMDLEEIAVVARRLGLTAAATRKAIHDLRKQFHECLLEAVADTLDPEDPPPGNEPGPRPAVERELAELYASLLPAPAREVCLAP